MNKVILTGRLTDEPKISETNSGKKVARFNLAVDRTKEGTDFPSIIAWEKRAEFIEKYCHKGVKYLVEGRIQTGSYKNQKGDTVYTTDVIADRVEFLGGNEGQTPQRNTAPPQDEYPGFSAVDDDVPY